MSGGSNINGKFHVQSEPSSLDQFDSFPPEIRQIVRDAPYNISTAGIARLLALGANAAQINHGIEYVRRQSTILTYGPDHPQAK